jgi:hypothetical protein
MPDNPVASLFWSSEPEDRSPACYKATAHVIYHCGNPICHVNLNTSETMPGGYSRVRCKHCGALNDLPAVKFPGEIATL